MQNFLSPCLCCQVSCHSLIYFFLFSFHYFQFHKNNKSTLLPPRFQRFSPNTYSHLRLLPFHPPIPVTRIPKRAMEDLLSELQHDTTHNPNAFNLPPGFRFHPTDDELVTFYLLSKAFHNSTPLLPSSSFFFAEIDLCSCEPWDLPDCAKMGEREWYFYSMRDRKHPTRVRTNRATAAGYWKATGKDREVYSGVEKSIVGLKKTLVFYKGRAPRGVKTRWVMHEYRLHGCFSLAKLTPSPPSLLLKEWVMCRIRLKAGEKGKSRCGRGVGEGEERDSRMEEKKRVLLIPEVETCFVEEEVGGYEGLVGGWGLEEGLGMPRAFWDGCGSLLSSVYYE